MRARARTSIKIKFGIEAAGAAARSQIGKWHASHLSLLLLWPLEGQYIALIVMFVKLLSFTFPVLELVFNCCQCAKHFSEQFIGLSLPWAAMLEFKLLASRASAGKFLSAHNGERKINRCDFLSLVKTVLAWGLWSAVHIRILLGQPVLGPLVSGASEEKLIGNGGQTPSPSSSFTLSSFHCKSRAWNRLPLGLLWPSLKIGEAIFWVGCVALSKCLVT